MRVMHRGQTHGSRKVLPHNTRKFMLSVLLNLKNEPGTAEEMADPAADCRSPSRASPSAPSGFVCVGLELTA